MGSLDVRPPTLPRGAQGPAACGFSCRKSCCWSLTLQFARELGNRASYYYYYYYYFYCYYTTTTTTTTILLLLLPLLLLLLRCYYCCYYYYYFFYFADPESDFPTPAQRRWRQAVATAHLSIQRFHDVNDYLAPLFLLREST